MISAIKGFCSWTGAWRESLLGTTSRASNFRRSGLTHKRHALPVGERSHRKPRSMKNPFRWWQDRARLRRAAAVLTSLRAGAPAASDVVRAATADAAPDAVRLALLRKNFPFLPRHEWVPSMIDLGYLVELKAYFSGQRCSTPPWRNAQSADGIEELSRHSSRRR